MCNRCFKHFISSSFRYFWSNTEVTRLGWILMQHGPQLFRQRCSIVVKHHLVVELSNYIFPEVKKDQPYYLLSPHTKKQKLVYVACIK